MSLHPQWNHRGPRRQRILLVNEEDQVPLTVIIVAPKGPDWATVWSPVGSVQGTDNVPILMPNPNCTMPEDMAHLSAICLWAKVKRDRAPLAKWQTAQYITHLLGDSLLWAVRVLICAEPYLTSTAMASCPHATLGPRRRKLDLERHSGQHICRIIEEQTPPR